LGEPLERGLTHWRAIGDLRNAARQGALKD
jgi:hypothetical protein